MIICFGYQLIPNKYYEPLLTFTIKTYSSRITLFKCILENIVNKNKQAKNSLYRIKLHEHLKTCRIVPSKILCSKVSTLKYEVHDIKHLHREL
jgi:hypothetical protein